MRNDKNMIMCFNRCLCVLGIGFFNAGNFIGTKECLHDILSSNNIENLISQYNPKKTKIFDTEDPLSTFPYHMHLNIEEIETCFLIASIVTESHAIVNESSDMATPVVNSKLLSFLNKYKNNFFVNSIDSVSDCIFIVFREIIRCNAQKAYSYITKIKYLENKTACLSSLNKFIKLECFNVYIEKIKNEKEISFSIDDLSHVFELKKESLIKIINGKIRRGQLSGQWSKKDQVFNANNLLNKLYSSENELSLLGTLKQIHEQKQMREIEDNKPTLFKQYVSDKRTEKFMFIIESQLYRRTLS